MKRRASGMVVAVFVLLAAGMALANSISSPDTGNVFLFTSLALDADGFPVVAYQDDTVGVLKVMHCNDATCAGGDESIEVVDATGFVGQDVSLALDGAGNPVASYYDATNDDLKILHCNDPDCAGGDESITSPDTAGDVGTYSSLALDENGYAVVSYYDQTNADLKVMHCNDANCAGGDESITTVDAAGSVGVSTSLVLDGNGYPVISYHLLQGTDGDLKLVHCNDADCAGGDESISSPDTTGNVGVFNALALDGDGYPVIAYHDRSGNEGALKVMHCNDENCVGGDESIVVVDEEGRPGWDVSLLLDGDGYPVASYYDPAEMDLRVLRCNDANCAGGDESVKRPDVAGDVGIFTSLALDASGNPVVSYAFFDDENDEEYGELRILSCDDALCNMAPVVDAGSDLTATEGEVALFVGSASDQDGDALLIDWDFGDGETASGSLTPSHAYAAAGVYTATLTVDDGDGGVASDTLTVTVEEAPGEWLYLPAFWR